MAKTRGDKNRSSGGQLHAKNEKPLTWALCSVHCVLLIKGGIKVSGWEISERWSLAVFFLTTMNHREELAMETQPCLFPTNMAWQLCWHAKDFWSGSLWCDILDMVSDITPTSTCSPKATVYQVETTREYWKDLSTLPIQHLPADCGSLPYPFSVLAQDTESAPGDPSVFMLVCMNGYHSWWAGGTLHGSL